MNRRAFLRGMVAAVAGAAAAVTIPPPKRKRIENQIFEETVICDTPNIEYVNCIFKRGLHITEDVRHFRAINTTFVNTSISNEMCEGSIEIVGCCFLKEAAPIKKAA